MSTDAPTIVDITLTEEYEKLASVFGWVAGDFYKCKCVCAGGGIYTGSVKAGVAGEAEGGVWHGIVVVIFGTYLN